jgi:preprotein translocase subunit SecA
MATLNNIQQLLQTINTPIEFDLTPYQTILEEINKFHQENIRPLADADLSTYAHGLIDLAQQGAQLNDLFIQAYALVKEACYRQLGLNPYDVQIMAGIAMHQGKLIEMQTGEGKTLAALFPAYLNAITGKGVHVLTFNDYLAQRDANWMRPVYQMLGLSVDFIQEGMDQRRKRKAYNADITYATAKEIGFDYLRSFIAYDEKELILRPFHFAIIDEADALLIDEARNPLVLAGDIIETDLDFYQIATIAGTLELGEDFDLNGNSRNIFLTEKGLAKLEEKLGVEDIQSDENHALYSAISLAVHAKTLLKRDIHYVVRDNAIKLVDEFTGRIVEDRKWRNGLQTAVEAKEQVPIQTEGMILNSISLPHFIYQYPRKAGMTATAQDSTEEFWDFYGLPVVVIPPNQTCQRIDHPDAIFATMEAKRKALVQEVKRANKLGQPVLVGTLTVKESESLADLFVKEGIDCKVLNAKNDQLEAAIIAEAGRLGAVTISTNMAGRGTDIVLGGKDGKEREQVVALGGLYVIGTNRHESRRIDKQLKGRAGRQGDIGQSRFFISLEDHLMEKYQLKKALPKRHRHFTGEEPLQNKILPKFINHIQRVIEAESFAMRKNLFLYADLLEKQRKIIQNQRQEILEDPHLLEDLIDLDINKIQQCPNLFTQLKELCLFQFDRSWADYLDHLVQVKEGIHLVRFGGQNPLHEFQRIADESFSLLNNSIAQAIQEKAAALMANPELSAEDLGMKKPSSTWTYVVSDNGFGDQLAMKLLNSGNIGFQVDFISTFFLFFVGLYRKYKRKQPDFPTA